MATTAENDPELNKSGTSTEGRQSAVSDVQSQIDVLADLSKRLQTVRQLPGGVLRSEVILGANQVLQPPSLKDIFGKSAQDLRTLQAAAVEGKVQDALRVAAESERRDGSEIKDYHAREREGQKRRCVPRSRAFSLFVLLPPLPTCGLNTELISEGVFFFSFLFSFVMQPLSHPRISEAILALAAEGRESVSPASRGCTAPHARRPAVIHTGV